jgi:hypothetical protein
VHHDAGHIQYTPIVEIGLPRTPATRNLLHAYGHELVRLGPDQRAARVQELRRTRRPIGVATVTRWKTTRRTRRTSR